MAGVSVVQYDKHCLACGARWTHSQPSCPQCGSWNVSSVEWHSPVANPLEWISGAEHTEANEDEWVDIDFAGGAPIDEILREPWEDEQDDTYSNG